RRPQDYARHHHAMAAPDWRATPLLRLPDQTCASLLLWQELWIPGHFPQMPIGILEVAGISSIKRLARRLDYRRSSLLGLSHHLVYFLLPAHIMRKGKIGGAGNCLRHIDIVSDIRPLPDRQLQAWLEIEKCDGSMLKLPSHDSRCLKSQPVPIEG